MTAPAISVDVAQDRAVIALSGEHEAYTADKLARNLGGLIAEGVPVTIDLCQATFIDSTVVGVLMAAHRRATESEVGFALRIGEETGWPVRRLLELTGLADELDIRH